MYVCVFEGVLVHHVHLGAHSEQKRVSDSLELELYRCVKFHWVVGTGPDSSTREVNVLYCQGISLAPWVIILSKPPATLYIYMLVCM